MMFNQWGYFDSITNRLFAYEANRVFKAPNTNEPMDLVETFDIASIVNPPPFNPDTYNDFCELIQNKQECDNMANCSYNDSNQQCEVDRS